MLVLFSLRAVVILTYLSPTMFTLGPVSVAMVISGKLLICLVLVYVVISPQKTYQASALLNSRVILYLIYGFGGARQ